MISFRENAGRNKLWKYLSRGGVSRVILFVGALLLISVIGVLSRSPDGTIIKEKLLVPMRDGVKLQTTLFRKADLTGRHPVLLLRTPYSQQGNAAQAERFAQAGYIVLTQDCRGRYGSEGAYPFYNGEGQDGYDSVTWIRKQPWCDGQVGMWGHSYPASSIWLAAGEGAPISAAAPAAGATNFYYNQYLGGVYQLQMARAGFGATLFGPPREAGSSPNWSKWYLTLPTTDLETVVGHKAPWQMAFLEHNRRDGFWKPTDVTRDIGQMNFPAQVIVGYYDFLTRESVHSFLLMSERSATSFSRTNQQLIIGPWDHGVGKTKVADVDFGPQAKLDVVDEHIVWFDRFLKKKSGAPFPRIRYFMMGENAWRTADQWPPAETTPTPFYLHSQGHANTAKGDGKLDRFLPKKQEPSSDSFRADPTDPVPTVPAFGNEYRDTWGPTDQRTAQNRADVLVYSTGPLKEPLSFAGPLKAELVVSTDTPDADWAVRLIDLHPDGFAHPLATGIQRGSFRESEIDPTPMEKGKQYRLVVDLGHSAARVDAGHSLQVQVAGTCFPIFERNLNTGEGPGSAKIQVATEQIWHTPKLASRVLLPVLSSGSSRQAKH